jgi:hypothetical protein
MKIEVHSAGFMVSHIKFSLEEVVKACPSSCEARELKNASTKKRYFLSFDDGISSNRHLPFVFSWRGRLISSVGAV